MIAYGIQFNNWCDICQRKDKGDGCADCISSVRLGVQSKPSKFYFKEREEKKMIITIIGSYKKKDEMLACKEYFERFGHKVNCPYNPTRDGSLIEAQKAWIKKIEEADLVVAISKEVLLSNNASATEFVMKFGESTSYEMAIAGRFNKQIVFW